MTTFLKITDKKNNAITYLQTKNKNLREFMYNWRKKNKVDYEHSVEQVMGIPVTEKEPDPISDKIKAECPHEGTARNYIAALKKYIAEGHQIGDMEAIEKYNENLPNGSREKFIYAMIKMVKNTEHDKVIQKLLELSRLTRGITQLERIKSLNSQKTKETLSINDLKIKSDAIPEGNFTLKFISKLYVMEAWRAGTVVAMTKDKKEVDNNIVFLIKKEIKLNRFKTVGFYGRKTVPISTGLASLMRKQFKNTKSRWLLPDPKDIDKPMSANTLSKLVIQIFGVGIKELRHIHITHGRKTLNNEGFVKLCERMNTSAGTGLCVYNDTKQ